MASTSTSVATADFNGDGKMDLVVTNSTFNAVYVALNGGASAQFGSKKVFNSGGEQPVYVKVGDFNGDGKIDLAVANSASAPGNVAILLGDGTGSFGAPTTYAVGSNPVSITSGDFNGDGKLDLAVANNGSQNISILLGNGAGGFAPATNLSSGGTSPNSIAAADFGGDGKLDLVVVNGQGASLVILSGDGAGNFTHSASYASGATDPKFVSANDLNGDGRPDLVVGHEASRRVSILLNTCAAAETAALRFSANRYSVYEDSGAATLTVQRTGLLSTAVSVNYRIVETTATLGADYTEISGTLTFASGETTKTLTLPILNDSEAESNELLVLQLSAPTGGAILGIPATIPLTILDDDSCSYFINSVERVAPASGETLTINVTARAGCAWTAASQSGFISVTSGASGSGNGSVVLDVSGNGSGLSRTGTVTIAGETFTVRQVALGPEEPAIRFVPPARQLSESDGRATITVMRTGDTSAAASVDYRTFDTDTFTVGCADRTNNQFSAYARCDFATTVGRFNFAAGESQKTITIPIIDDGHDEDVETFQVVFSNLTGATAGATATMTVSIFDNDVENTPNPVTTSLPFFVRQQYLDFLSREPDQGGFDAWLGVLSNCADVNTGPNTPSQCDRIYVSGEGFFRSQEFQLKGFYVFRFYKVAFNRLPEYTEIVSDMSFVAGATAEEVYARKAQLATSFTQRAEFQTLYTAMSDAQFVDTLLGKYGLTQVTTPDPQQPDGTVKVTLTRTEMANRLTAGTLTRAQVLRAIADSDAVGAREFNNAFVGMQYYGYLRRKPDEEGFQAWLRVLQAGNVRTMVDGFLNSIEYKLRFGQP
ncbi:MAG TPA: FG-GAP-like repeat-containing protein [Pyrinomonadaceae bacterium]